MDARKSSAPAHPSTEDHDDTVEAHYASLERPHACIDGWVFVGYIDEHLRPVSTNKLRLLLVGRDA